MTTEAANGGAVGSVTDGLALVGRGMVRRPLGSVLTVIASLLTWVATLSWFQSAGSMALERRLVRGEGPVRVITAGAPIDVAPFHVLAFQVSVATVLAGVVALAGAGVLARGWLARRHDAAPIELRTAVRGALAVVAAAFGATLGTVAILTTAPVAGALATVIPPQRTVLAVVQVLLVPAVGVGVGAATVTASLMGRQTGVLTRTDWRRAAPWVAAGLVVVGVWFWQTSLVVQLGWLAPTLGGLGVAVVLGRDS